MMMTQYNFVIGSKKRRKNVNEILPLTLEFITSQADPMQHLPPSF